MIIGKSGPGLCVRGTGLLLRITPVGPLVRAVVLHTMRGWVRFPHWRLLLRCRLCAPRDRDRGEFPAGTREPLDRPVGFP